MKWPWHKNTDEAEKLHAAEDALRRVDEQWPTVHEQAAELRAHHARNHFAEAISLIYRGER